LTNTQAGFATIHSDWVLDTLESSLSQRLSPLCLERNSYINRVYECESRADKTRFIVKFYRPGRWSKAQLLEEHHFLQALSEAELNVVAPININGDTLLERDGIYFSIFPKKGGRALDEFSEQHYEEIGRLIARMHQVSASFVCKHRLTWSPTTVSHTHLQQILHADSLRAEYKDRFNTVATQVIQKIEPAFEGVQSRLIHGDLHFSNIIERPNEGLTLLDFDDCVRGPRIQDIWMLLPEASQHNEKEIQQLAKGYDTFADFPYEELALIPALRAMRQIHFIAWCASQEAEAHFKHHFPNWGSMSYWNESIKELQHFLYDA